MKNADYTKLLRRAARAMNKAQALVRECETEYKRRYGESPSEVDDDIWIDSMTGASGACNDAITWEHVDNGATNYAGLEPYRENVQAMASADTNQPDTTQPL